MQKGTLFLLPTLLGPSSTNEVLPQAVIEKMHHLKLFAVENIRTARRYLIKSGISTPVDELEFLSVTKHSTDEELTEIVMRLIQGEDIGLLSESGIPCVADPGSLLVSKAHEFRVKVIPLTGPSSIMLGLMASGFSGQNFSFHGYLPIADKDREKRLKFLEKLVYNEHQTQIFIETPYRNVKLFKSMLKVCSAYTKIALGIELTTPEEQMLVYTVGEWKNQQFPPVHKRNVIFLMYK